MVDYGRVWTSARDGAQDVGLFDSNGLPAGRAREAGKNSVTLQSGHIVANQSFISCATFNWDGRFFTASHLAFITNSDSNLV
jgi:hypothetical protein